MRDEAIRLGMCESGAAAWEGIKDDDGLIRLYKRFLDFAIEKDWPSVGYIMGNFDRLALHTHGIYCNEPVDGGKPGPDGVMVLNGVAHGHVEFGGFDVATVQVRHKSDVEIGVGGFARVRVCVHDLASVKVSGDSASTVYVYLYGDGCRCEPEGRVAVRKGGA